VSVHRHGRPLFRACGIERAATRPHAVLAGLRLPGAIGTRLNRAATVRWGRARVALRLPGRVGRGSIRQRQRGLMGPGWSPAIRSDCLEVRPGGDSGVAAGLWSLFGCPVGLGPGSIGQRQRGDGRAPVVLRLPCPIRSKFDLAAMGSGWWGAVFCLGHAEGPDPSRGSGCAA
jgi:hypothetical protein